MLAAAGEEPIATADLWTDSRWPHLTLDAVRSQLPEQHHLEVSRVRGVAAWPGIWDDDGVVVLSVYLERPADERTLATLARHERLVASAITIADVATRSADQAEQVLNVLASRSAIEQAKGVLMALQRCDADEAWAVLRRASQQFNIKVRELAAALVEHISQASAQQSGNADCAVDPHGTARHAAEMIWHALTQQPPRPLSPSPR